MIANTLKIIACLIAAALLFPLAEGEAFAESLNPQGVNPHAEAPKKRISLDQKIAAAEARKKKQAEIAARKNGQPAPSTTTNQGALPANLESELINNNK